MNRSWRAGFLYRQMGLITLVVALCGTAGATDSWPDKRPLTDEESAAVLEMVAGHREVLEVTGGVSDHFGRGFVEVVYEASISGSGCLSPSIDLAGRKRDGEWEWEVVKYPYLGYEYFPDAASCENIQVEDGIGLSPLIDTDTLERLMDDADSIYQEAVEYVQNRDLPATYESISSVGMERLSGRNLERLEGRVVYRIHYTIDSHHGVKVLLRYPGYEFVVQEAYFTIQ